MDRVAENFSSQKLGKEVEEACRQALTMGDVHGQMGDKLIWAGPGLMAFAALNLSILLWFYGGAPAG
jgi:alpha-1,3/alpha-1,6-mannosyltransferase